MCNRTPGDDQRNDDLNSATSSFVYNGPSFFFFVSPALLGVLLIFEFLMPEHKALSGATIDLLYQQGILHTVRVYAQQYKLTADLRNVFNNFCASDLASYIIERVLPDIKKTAYAAFSTVLRWHNVGKLDDLHAEAAGYASLASDYIAGHKQAISCRKSLWGKWWMAFLASPGISGLCSVGVFYRAASAAALEVSLYLTRTFPSLVFAFLYERYDSNVLPTAISRTLGQSAPEELLTKEQRANVERHILGLAGKDCASVNSEDRSIITAFFDRDRFCSFRGALSMACRVFTAQSSAGGHARKQLNGNKDNVGFIAYLRSTGMTPEQLVDYALSGAEYHFGLYVPESIRCKVYKAARLYTGSTVIDVLTGIVGRDDSAAFVDYIQRSNSKVNQAL